MKKNIVSAIVVSGLLILAASLYSEEQIKQDSQEIKPQTLCPIMGNKINKSLFVDAQGKRIYVCCNGCIGTVKADPAKYIKDLEAKGITLEEIPKDKAAAGDAKAGAPKMEHKGGCCN